MGNGGIQLRISDLLFAVQKRWAIIVALTFIGGLFGVLLTGMSYVQSSLASYNISGTMAINTLRADGTYLYGDDAPSQNDFHLAEDMVDTVIYMLRSVRVLNEVINREELLGVDYTDIRSGMSVTSYNGTQILEMTINWSNDEEGKAIWNAIVDCANELMPETLQIGHLAVINQCTAILVGVGGMGKTVPIFLAMLGFVAGLGFAIMELLMHPTLINVKDVETVFGLETIGLIPRDEAHFKKKGSILVNDEATSSVVTQNYSAAAYILRNRLGTKEKHHCFYVTSATNREGRSTVAANLAIQLSDMEHHTLLVDFDTKNPSLGALFMNNVDYEHSLNALYRGEITEQEAITTLTGYLDILPSVLEYNSVSLDGMVIDLIKKLSERYEYVILDAPPVGKESDTLSLNQIANTVLYVVGYDNATIPAIQDALEKLDKSGIRVLGCVVNNVQGIRYRDLGSKDDARKRIQHAQTKKRDKKKEFSNAQKEDENPMVSAAASKKLKTKQEKKSGAKGKATDAEQPQVNQHIERERRNIIEELSEEEHPKQTLSDQDMFMGLYKIGLDSEQEETNKGNGENSAGTP